MKKKRMSREEALESTRFKSDLAKALKDSPGRKRCKHGHDLTNPKHVHVGDLLRTGRITCNTCWMVQNEAYLKRNAMEAKTAAKKR
jgi:hypothetical protein